MKNNRKLFQIICAICSLSVFLVINGCNHKSEVEIWLDLAESMMESYPDSALTILDGIENTEFRGRRIKARHALLKSMALDKNYIDTAAFDVLQPAIDYYLKHGNADEQLRTLYYRGRIYKNAGEDDRAMQSYMDALELGAQITDSLTLARLLVAQGVLLYKQYRIKEFVDNNIRAGELYGKFKDYKHEIRSYSRALDGVLRIQDKRRADSLANLCRTIIKDESVFDQQAEQALFEYILTFGSISEIKEAIGMFQQDRKNVGMDFNLARAYSKIGEPEAAFLHFEKVRITSEDVLDSLTYLTAKTRIYENLGFDKESLKSFRAYTNLLEKYHLKLFSNELLFSEKKHEMEVENMKNIQKKNEIIVLISVGVIVLLCVAGLIYYRYRLNRAGLLIAEQKAERLQLEGEKLLLEADNLRMMVGQLEGERSRLSLLLEKQGELSEDLRRIVEDRLKMLNGLLASEITKEDSHAKQYKKYVEAIKKDSKKFQREIRRDLETTYPDFFRHLSELGLTTKEIDYVCLYAIGLRGKEIGVYLEASRHYSVSSGIRRKLGLDSRDENLGPYIRKLMTENQ